MKRIIIVLIVCIISSCMSVEPKCISGNCINGKSVLNTANGFTITANFINGLAQGKGTIVKEGDYKYSGDIKDNLPSGQGTTYSYRLKYRYTGEYLNGSQHGKGVIQYDNGLYVQGQFKNDYLNGNGKVFDSDKHLVVFGNFKGGKVSDARYDNSKLQSLSRQNLNMMTTIAGYSSKNCNNLKPVIAVYDTKFDLLLVTFDQCSSSTKTFSFQLLDINNSIIYYPDGLKKTDKYNKSL